MVGLQPSLFELRLGMSARRGSKSEIKIKIKSKRS
jgi:hypothetical protein